jgi:hypothetical protein
MKASTRAEKMDNERIRALLDISEYIRKNKMISEQLDETNGRSVGQQSVRPEYLLA